ncbi:putative 2-hydroxyacid dehydrogenase YPL113C [Diutina catenulata]
MTAAKSKVLFLETPNFDSLDYQRFAVRHDCIHYDFKGDVSKLYEDFATSGDEICAIYGGYLGLARQRVHGKEVAEIFPNLKVIALSSVGYDNYNGHELAGSGIALTNAPSELAYSSVADLALYNTLSSFRNFKLFEHNIDAKLNDAATIRFSLFNSKFDSVSGQADLTVQRGHAFAHSVCGRGNLSPAGHNVVIVGFGQIGTLIGKRLSTIGMNVHYVKRTPLSAAEEAKLGYPVTYHSSLKDTCGFADLIILACPGGPSTYHMVDDSLLDPMSRPIRVINIGRGTVVDEQALIKGLRSGKVLFAALDVFEEEPHISPELIGRQDVVITPHIGSATIQNFNLTMAIALDNIDTVLSGRDTKAMTRVN